jgi:hypothetical protein
VKTFFFFISILFLATSVNGQSDRWKIFHAKKLLLSATEESEAKNVVKFKRADLNKGGQLSIEFREAIPNKDWIRTFAIFDDRDSALFERRSFSSVRITNASLKKMSEGKTKIKIYTWSLPQNSKLASTIRIRRVHLCTLELE